MNKAGTMISPELESLEDRVDILFKELELAVKWQRPSILLAVYRSRYVYADAVASLENHLTDLGQKVVCFQMKNSQNPDLVSLISAVASVENTVLFVDGLQSKLRPDGYNVYRTLNLSRDYFVKNSIRVVFWLTENEVTNLAHFAPDYWAFRHRVVEFVESPQPEQILLRALESTWQVAGEYTDTLEDTDEKIKLRHVMLTELPEAPESTGIRANLLLTLGILHWRKGNLEKALEFLLAALAITATIEESWMEAACYNAIALVQTDLGAIDEAIAAYQQAIKLTPDQIFPWNNLGNLYQKLDRNAEALEAFHKAIEHNERDGIAWNGIGNAHFKLGEVGEAIKAYQAAIELAPDFANPWNGLGNVYVLQTKTEAAIAAFEKATALNQNFVTPWISLGKLFAEIERAQDALRAYWNALRIDPKNAHIWNALGNVYFQSNGFEEAIRAYNKAIDLDRDFESSYTNLAVAYARTGQHEKAIACYQKSVELLTTRGKDSAERLPLEMFKLEPPKPLAGFGPTLAGSWTPAEQPVPVSDDGVIVETEIAVGEISAAAELETLNQEVAQETPVGAAVEVEPVLVAADPSDNGALATDEEIQRLAAGTTTQPSVPSEDLEPFIANTFIEAIAEADVTSVDVPSAVANVELRAEIEEAPEAPAAAVEVLDQTLAAVEPVNALETVVVFAAQISDSDAAVHDSEVSAEATAQAPEALDPVGASEAVAASAAQVSDTVAAVHESAVSAEATVQTSEAIDQVSESEALPASAESEAVVNETIDQTLPAPVMAEVSDVPQTAPAEIAQPLTEGQVAVDVSQAVEAKTMEVAPEAKDAQFFNELGNFYFNVGAFDDAALAYKKAIEFDPWFGWAYSNLALAYSLQKKMDEAVAVYEKITEMAKREDGYKLCWVGSGKAVQFPRDDGEAHVVKQTSDAMYFSATTAFENIREVSIDAIYPNPRQPRFDVNVDDLVESVKVYGVIQPLIVTPNGTPGMFILIAGERRLEAARQAGLTRVPVVIREVNDRERLELALVENAQREDLKPIELATAYKQLADEFGLSHDEIAARVGKSRAAVTNTIRLLKLSEKVKFALMDQRISEGHARAMLSLSSPQAQNAALQYVLDNALSVRQTEEMVRSSAGLRPTSGRPPEASDANGSDAALNDDLESEKVMVRREYPVERSSLFQRARSLLLNSR